MQLKFNKFNVLQNAQSYAAYEKWSFENFHSNSRHKQVDEIKGYSKSLWLADEIRSVARIARELFSKSKRETIRSRC